MGILDMFQESDKKKQARYEKVLEQNNVFEGVKFKVVFPSKELRIATRSGLTRGAATLGFGLVGLAAASGIKQEEKNRTLITDFQIADKGVVFKRAAENGKDLRIPYENIVVADDISTENNPKNLINLTLLENQKITLFTSELNLYIDEDKVLRKHIISIINERACGAQYEESGWGLEHATAEPQETKQESESLMDELERLANLYEKGLLSDDEFALAKKKLLEGDSL